MVMVVEIYLEQVIKVKKTSFAREKAAILSKLRNIGIIGTLG